jgi:hypothetical protein
MVKGVKFRRGTTAEHAAFTGAEGEITINTDKDIAVVHDGTTVGGKELVGIAATQAITNKTLISATNVTVSGVSTFTTGPVLIGTGTSTGTADQDFQVVGGGYISGNLGIGTTNPDHLLSINGATNHIQVSGQTARVRVNRPDASGTNAFDFQTNGLFDWAFGSVSTGSSDLFYRSRNDGATLDVLTLKYLGGNVGVGTTNPISKLDVAGNGNFTGGISATGIVTTTTLAVTGFSTARNLTVVGVTTSSTVNDSKGDVRAIPQNAQTGAYILAASDAGKHIDITTGGVTVNASIFSVGDVVTVYNDSGSSQTITQGTNVTLRLAATATTGTRTLAQYGICTLLCVTGGANPVFIISGAGLT